MEVLPFSIAPARASDDAEILALQDANHVSNVAAEALASGFVTTQLTPEYLEQMRLNNGVWVARASSGELAAYSCANDWPFYGDGAFQQLVRSRLPIPFGAGEITIDNSFQYGPACIATGFRGSGLAGLLAENAKAHYAPRFEFGLTFIDVRNARSLAAHERKLGFRTLTILPTDHADYYMLGFETRSER